MGQKYSRKDQVKFVEAAFKKFEEVWSASSGRVPW